MLGYRIPEIVLGALLTTLVFAMGFLTASQFFPQTPQVQTKQESAHPVDQKSDAAAPPASKVGEHPQASRNDTHEQAHEVTIFGVRIGEGVLAFATVLLVLATWRLVVDARENAQRQLRAYVTAFGAAIHRVERMTIDVGRQVGFDFQINFKNSGQTPAYDVTTWLFVGLRRPGEQTPFTVSPPPDQRPSRSVIGPSGTSSMIDTAWFGPQGLADLESGARLFFIWGEVGYRDAFDNWRTSTFRYMSNFDTQRREWGLVPDREGNEAD